MHIYQHRVAVAILGTTADTVTLNVRGGLMRQLLIRTTTTGTIFRANLVDSNSLTVRNWGYHTGEMIDVDPLPLVGTYTINLTNASQADSANILVSVEE